MAVIVAAWGSHFCYLKVKISAIYMTAVILVGTHNPTKPKVGELVFIPFSSEIEGSDMGWTLLMDIKN